MKKSLTINGFTVPFKLALRYQQIWWCFFKYGVVKNITDFGFEMTLRGIAWTGAIKKIDTSLLRLMGANLARAFQELGPTFIKFGQLLATRPDLLPPEISQELEVLLAAVKPVSIKKITGVLKQELGKELLDELFLEIDKKPLGSASLGQCHRATLRNGSIVVVKVQKPGVSKTLLLDLKLIEMIISVLSLGFSIESVQEAFEDFRGATLQEIDYQLEAKNIDRFRKNYKGLLQTPSVVFPTYIQNALTAKVLILELMRGVPFTYLKKGSRPAKRAAYRSLEAVFEQIFQHGFFHADPHAANMFFIEEEGRVGFIDLGLVGELSERDKKLFLKILLAIVRRDRKDLSQALFKLGVPGRKTCYEDFERDIDRVLDDVKATGLKKLKIQKIVNQLFDTARTNSLKIPNRYVMMVRSCVMIEGVAKSLDPEISLFKVALPVLTKGFMSNLLNSMR